MRDGEVRDGERVRAVVGAVIDLNFDDAAHSTVARHSHKARIVRAPALADAFVFVRDGPLPNVVLAAASLAAPRGAARLGGQRVVKRNVTSAPSGFATYVTSPRAPR